MDFEKILTRIMERGPDAIAEELLQEIEREYGRVPLIFERMAERPEILISHLLYKGAVSETSQLEPKVIELISLAVGAALKCSHCVEYHMQTAMAKGATRAEILEVILIAGMLANSAVLADAYRVVDVSSTSCPTCDLNGVGLNKTCSDK
ncbi:MAG TPA: carboxymuconolactone decarboxylase family protein [Methanoculleus sp.]|jgi:AhpD family alkylhydroperoxidase|nr:carboxymuconolactone decarboxylase family protein [Methanoculleus sp.]MBP8676079.1 carboxymuconolactone decarboxylase family protein [Methanoculleus sp.]HIH85707.1 carboxymuconolactone decarboxylase family protein [Methanoculleus sp.]HOB06930.1 carboxymuconolactone decarboxylase family protein [Methanoculleus sp.]HOD85003.1 carboxymuconolactone decarboxylase family protein [Methanoculleus sp.]